MKSMHTWSAMLVVTSSICWAQDAAANDAVLIRWQSFMQTPQFEALLNDYVPPISIEVKSDDDFLSAVQESCNFNPDKDAQDPVVAEFNKIFNDLNGASARDWKAQNGSARSFSLPVCVPASGEIEVSIGPNDSVGSLLTKFYGTDGPEAHKQFYGLNKINERKFDPLSLQIGQKLKFPKLSSWERLQLREGKSADAFIADASQLTKASTLREVIQAAQNADLDKKDPTALAAQVAAALAITPAPEKDEAVDESEWHDNDPTCGSNQANQSVDLIKLARALAINERLLAAAQLSTSLRSADIGVADYGFDTDLVDPSKTTSFSGWVNGVAPEIAHEDVIKALRGTDTTADHGIGVVFMTGGGEISDALRQETDRAVRVTPYGFLMSKTDSAGSPHG